MTTIFANATPEGKQVSIESINNEAKQALNAMKHRWEVKKSLVCKLTIGSKKTDIEKVIGSPILNDVIEPDDEFYKNQVSPIKVEFVAGRLSQLDYSQCPDSTPKMKVVHKSLTTQDESYKSVYGSSFNELSNESQQYISKNYPIMKRIVQEQLNRLAPVNIPHKHEAKTFNIVEFICDPNGYISSLKIKKSSGDDILDETTLQTIEYSLYCH